MMSEAEFQHQLDTPFLVGSNPGRWVGGERERARRSGVSLDPTIVKSLRQTLHCPRRKPFVYAESSRK